jgi:hypothetical protein
MTGEPVLPARTANQYLARYWFGHAIYRSMINRMTGEPVLPARTANQYLARYWFAVRAGKTGLPVMRFITTVESDIIARVPLATPTMQAVQGSWMGLVTRRAVGVWVLVLGKTFLNTS